LGLPVYDLISTFHGLFSHAALGTLALEIHASNGKKNRMSNLVHLVGGIPTPLKNDGVRQLG